MNRKEHVVKEVVPGSIAQEMGIEKGDVLLSVNDNEIEDVFDYRFLMKDEYVEVLVRKADGEEWLLEIDKDYDDDLGVEFENSLMSDYRSCSNKCIFCFIDQMPPGMRETLYFKDDDSRLSFLQGNYITLTNMTGRDVERIVKMQLAPINISVQTTNPELRCRMLHNRFAGEKLRFLDRFYEGHVEMNGQIVCCKGVNDGEELRRSITDLMRYLPFMRSVSVVPAGITKYRENLYPLELFTREEAGEIIDMIEEYQKICFDRYGLHFIHASDEFYMLANRDFPEEERYDGYIQLENGVGMMRLFQEEFEEAFGALSRDAGDREKWQQAARTVTIATGTLAFPVIQKAAEKMMEACPGLRIHVCAIRNDFFGETITVAGLVTGQDMIDQLGKRQQAGEELGDTLLIPVNMLRSGEQVFLDDVTVRDVEESLGIPVTVMETGGQDFVEALLNPSYRMERENDVETFVYVQGYGGENKMESYKVKKLDNDEIGQIYTTYMKEDFPSDELKPLSHITRSMDAGYGFSLGIYEGEALVGYAVFILCEETKCALLDYFAILRDRRGTGLGHQAFSMFETYFEEELPEVEGLYIESERVSAARDEGQRLTRSRRIAFYQSCGCEMTTLRSVLFGVDYSVLYKAFGEEKREASLSALLALYKKMFKKEHYDRFVTLSEMGECDGENGFREHGEQGV